MHLSSPGYGVNYFTGSRVGHLVRELFMPVFHY